MLEPLDNYIAKDKAEVNDFYSDMNPRTLAQFRQHSNVNGYTYFIPWGYNTMGIWYNRKTFQAGKVPEPSPDWTWDEFLGRDGTEQAAAELRHEPDDRRLPGDPAVGIHQRWVGAQRHVDQMRDQQPAGG